MNWKTFFITTGAVILGVVVVMLLMGHEDQNGNRAVHKPVFL